MAPLPAMGDVAYELATQHPEGCRVPDPIHGPQRARDSVRTHPSMRARPYDRRLGLDGTPYCRGEIIPRGYFVDPNGMRIYMKDKLRAVYDPRKSEDFNRGVYLRYLAHLRKEDPTRWPDSDDEDMWDMFRTPPPQPKKREPEPEIPAERPPGDDHDDESHGGGNDGDDGDDGPDDDDGDVVTRSLTKTEWKEIQASRAARTRAARTRAARAWGLTEEELGEDRSVANQQTLMKKRKRTETPPANQTSAKKRKVPQTSSAKRNKRNSKRETTRTRKAAMESSDEEGSGYGAGDESDAMARYLWDSGYHSASQSSEPEDNALSKCKGKLVSPGSQPPMNSSATEQGTKVDVKLPKSVLALGKTWLDGDTTGIQKGTTRSGRMFVQQTASIPPPSKVSIPASPADWPSNWGAKWKPGERPW